MQTYITPSTKQRTSSASQFGIVAIILLATALRFFQLDKWSFWIEEHHTLRLLGRFDSIIDIVSSIRPFFFLLAKPVVDLLGVGEWSLRYIPVVIGLISIPVLYWMGKRLFDHPTGFTAALLLAILPWHIYWSQNARFYSLLLLLFSVASFYFWQGLEKDRLIDVLISFVFFILAVVTHTISVLMLVNFVVYFILLKVLPIERPPGLHWRNLLPFLLLPIVGYIFYEGLLFVLGQRSVFNEIYTQFFNQSTASFIGDRSPYFFLASFISSLGTPLALLAVVGSSFLLLKRSRKGLFLSLCAYGPVLSMMFLTLVASTANRYAFMTLFFWLLLATRGIFEFYQWMRANGWGWILLPLAAIAVLLTRDPVIEDFVYYLQLNVFNVLWAAVPPVVFMIGAIVFFTKQPKRKAAPALWGAQLIAMIVITHMVIADGLYYVYQHGQRENWRSMTAVVNNNFQDGDAIYSAMYPLGNYYLEQHVYDVRNVAADLDSTLRSASRVWFIDNADMIQVFGEQFAIWAESNCQLKENGDQYMHGRFWRMRIYLCAT